MSVLYSQGQLDLCAETDQPCPHLPAVKETLWGLLSATHDSELVSLLVDLFSEHFDLLYTTEEARREVVTDLLVKGAYKREHSRCCDMWCDSKCQHITGCYSG